MILGCFMLTLLAPSLTYPIIATEASSTAHTSQTKDGGLIIAGTMEGGSYLLKTDIYGNQQWKKPWNWMYQFNDVQQTRDGGYIICGAYYGGGDMAGLLLRTNPSGDTLWEKYFSVLDVSTFYELRSVQQTSDGGFIAGGSRYKPPQENNLGFVVRTDADGNSQWEDLIETPDTEAIYCIRQTSDGGYISIGVFDVWGYSPDGGDLHLYYVGLCKRDSSGNVVWDKQLSLTGSASSVLQTSDGGYLITCNGFANLVKTDSDGNIKWEKSYGSYFPVTLTKCAHHHLFLL